MADRRPYNRRYRAPIQRSRVPQVAMSKRPWLPEGEKAPPVRTYTSGEIATSHAARPDFRWH